MSVVLVDTSVLIDHLRGDARATDALGGRVVAGDALWSATPVRTEVFAGMRPREAKATHALLATLRWQDITVEIADRAGEMARRYGRSHAGIDTVDYLIAAATEALGATLMTMNVRHFPMIRGLAPPY